MRKGKSSQSPTAGSPVDEISASGNIKTTVQSKGQQVATNINLIEWSYEYFNNRFGLKHVTDRNFTQFIGTIIKYKDKYQRFRMFGRFLGLFEELEENDLKLYIDIVHNMFKTVLNFQILEQDEIVLLPIPRALDYFKLTFASRLTTVSMNHCLKIIKQKSMKVPREHGEKHLHLNQINDAVQLDDFGEFAIHTTNQLQAEKL